MSCMVFSNLAEEPTQLMMCTSTTSRRVSSATTFLWGAASFSSNVLCQSTTTHGLFFKGLEEELELSATFFKVGVDEGEHLVHSFGVDSTVPAQLLIPLHVHHQIFMVTKDLIQQTLINQRFAEMPSPSSARHTFFKVVVGFPFFSRNLYIYTPFSRLRAFPIELYTEHLLSQNSKQHAPPKSIFGNKSFKAKIKQKINIKSDYFKNF